MNLTSTENQQHAFQTFRFGLNIRSLRYNFEELELQVEEYLPELIFLTETWLTESDPLTHYNINGYQEIESKPRITGIRGGVAFYAKNEIAYEVLEYESELECLIGTFTFSKGNKKNFCVVYRPDSVLYSKFLELMESLLSFLRSQKNDCIIFGDFNINTLIENSESINYTNLLAAYGFKIQNSEPTRVTSTTATCLDHIISSNEINTKTVKITISDHYAIETDLSWLGIQNKRSSDNNYTLVRNLNHIKKNKILNFLFLLDQKLRQINENADVDTYVTKIIDCIINCLDRFAPEKPPSEKKHSPWINNKIKNRIQKRNLLFQKWIKDPSEQNRQALKNLRNEIRGLIRNAKREQNFKELGSNPSSKTIYKKLKYKNVQKQQVHGSLDANKMNKHFATIGQTLSSNIPHTDFTSNIKTVENSMVLNKTNIDEITAILKKLKNKRSTGPSGISNEILKLCSPVIEPYICKIVNKCIEEETFPDCLKVAKVISLYKKGDKTIPENYRPISLLSPIGKIIEKILHKQMNKYFTKYNLYSKNQFGFRSKRSCNHAVAELTDYIRNAIDERRSGSACFIDLEKAFDTLDHSILLQKLYRYGFREPIFNIIKNYLSNRKQYVLQDGKKSDVLSINTGVPQGSVLGPFLFLVYINDSPKECNLSMITLFADDTTVYNIGQNTSEEICNDIQNLRNWFNENKLTVNIGKCEYVCFGRAQPLSEEAFGQRISLKDHCKYLGVKIDEKLNFKEHIKYVTKKLNKFCGLMYKVRHIFPARCLLLFYKTIAKPIIKYGLMNYGATAKTNLDPIEKAQRRILRAIFFKKQTDSLENVYASHNILTIHETYIAELVCELFRQLRGNSPFDFVAGSFIPPDINTRRRKRGLLKITFSRTETKRRSLKNSIVKTYNWLKTLDLIPSNIKNLSENATKNLINGIAHNYVSNNRDLFNVYF